MKKILVVVAVCLCLLPLIASFPSLNGQSTKGQRSRYQQKNYNSNNFNKNSRQQKSSITASSNCNQCPSRSPRPPCAAPPSSCSKPPSYSPPSRSYTPRPCKGSTVHNPNKDCNKNQHSPRPIPSSCNPPPRSCSKPPSYSPLPRTPSPCPLSSPSSSISPSVSSLPILPSFSNSPSSSASSSYTPCPHASSSSSPSTSSSPSSSNTPCPHASSSSSSSSSPSPCSNTPSSSSSISLSPSLTRSPSPPTPCLERLNVVFVTPDTYTGAGTNGQYYNPPTSGGLQAFDRICRHWARERYGNGEENSFKAVLSTSSQNARDRFADRRGPVYTGAGTGLVVGDLPDLWEANYTVLGVAIDVDAKGEKVVRGEDGRYQDLPWTGSLSDGTLGRSNCEDWTMDNNRYGGGDYGVIPTLDGHWLQYGSSGGCGYPGSVYCLGVVSSL